LDLIEIGKAKFVEQDHNKATYAQKINKDEGKIIWKEDAQKIIAKINGLYPNPGAWFLFQGERYKVLKATLSDLEGQPGSVLDNSLTIACGGKSIKIEEIQRQGKSKQKTSEFLLGSKIKKDLINVFVPTTPNPTSGFLLMFPKDEVIYLDLTFEQASKFIVSAGTSNPD